MQFKAVLHVRRIFAAVYLSTQRMYRRALSAVEHTALQGTGVRRATHLAAEGVDLTHQMTLRRAADRRIARAVADRVHIYRKDGGFASEPCRRQSRLDTGMTGADNGYIIFTCEIC